MQKPRKFTGSSFLTDDELRALSDKALWDEHERADRNWRASDMEDDALADYRLRVHRILEGERRIFSAPSGMVDFDKLIPPATLPDEDEEPDRPVKKPAQRKARRVERDEHDVEAKSGGRFWIPDKTFKMALTPAQFTVYAYLCRKAGKSFTAWPARNTIAEACHVRPDTVSAVLHVLAERGMVSQRRRRNLSAVYTLTEPETWYQEHASNRLSRAIRNAPLSSSGTRLNRVQESRKEERLRNTSQGSSLKELPRMQENGSKRNDQRPGSLGGRRAHGQSKPGNGVKEATARRALPPSPSGRPSQPIREAKTRELGAQPPSRSRRAS